MFNCGFFIFDSGLAGLDVCVSVPHDTNLRSLNYLLAYAKLQSSLPTHTCVCQAHGCIATVALPCVVSPQSLGASPQYRGASRNPGARLPMGALIPLARGRAGRVHLGAQTQTRAMNSSDA